jgi:ATP-dependent RNA helicase RhlE
MTHEHSSFHGLGIAPKLLEILSRNRYTTPTPIQHQCIPFAIEQKDVIGIAQTGTGKTLAFGIPIVQSLAQKQGKSLIVVPTRELAIQVSDALKTIASPMGLKTAVLIGGESMNVQLKHLRHNPELLIATPGRLIDHLERKTVDLHTTRILVLDEADRMLDMGFLPQIKTILNSLPEQKQTMIFSATMPADIVSIATRYMKLPVRIEIAPPGTAAAEVSQELFFVESRDKTELLLNLLSEAHGSVLVFTRTKFGAKKLAKHIRSRSNHTATELHSDRSQAQRQEAMHGFRIGKYRVLVATDIAARGIDVTGIELVVNYDLPANGEDYVHRIGRTGRAGSIGHAISFAMPHQKADVKAIEQVIRSAVRVSPIPKFDGQRRDVKPPQEFREQSKSEKARDFFWKRSRSRRKRK